MRDPMLFFCLVSLAGCGQPSSAHASLTDQAEERLNEKLSNPEYLRVNAARVAQSAGSNKRIVCGTVSYTRNGVPSQGAERFVIFPGIVAVEGVPDKTFTFDYYYKKANCAA